MVEAEPAHASPPGAAVTDDYFANADRWQAELLELRRIALDLGLEEALKWRQPCYTHDGKNIVILGSFKDACVLTFFKGALLRDPEGVLSAPGENTRSARTLRFASVDQIREQEGILRAYVHEAIAIERAGQTVDRTTGAETPVPEELTQYFAQDPELQAAFEALTPGRRRGYLLHFSSAKQPAARIGKARSRILDGKGLNDCVCGLSKRMPGCDGSHKNA